MNKEKRIYEFNQDEQTFPIFAKEWEITEKPLKQMRYAASLKYGTAKLNMRSFYKPIAQFISLPNNFTNTNKGRDESS